MRFASNILGCFIGASLFSLGKALFFTHDLHAAQASTQSILAERRGDAKAENFWYACRDFIRGRVSAPATEPEEEA